MTEDLRVNISGDGAIIQIESTVHGSLLPDTYKDEFCNVKLFGLFTDSGARDENAASTNVQLPPPIPAHRSVLASQSQTLRELFTAYELRDSNQACHKFSDLNHAALDKVIEFVYKGECSFSADVDGIRLLKNVLIAADYLLIDQLKSGAEQAFKLVTENATTAAYFTTVVPTPMALWLLGRRCRCAHFESMARHKIAEKVNAVTTSAAFLNLTVGQLTALLEGFPVEQADVQAKLLINWIEREAARAQHTEKLLRLVRLEKLSASTLAQLTDSKLVFPTNPNLIDLRQYEARELVLQAWRSRAQTLASANSRLLTLQDLVLNSNKSEIS